MPSSSSLWGCRCPTHLGRAGVVKDKPLTAVPFRELSMYKGGEASAAEYTSELL